MHYDEEDPFVPVWEGPFIDAELVKMRIEEAHIPVDFGDALLPGHARVEVPRSYLAEVRDVIAGSAAPWPQIAEGRTVGLRVDSLAEGRTKALILYLIVFLALGSGVIFYLLWQR